MSMYKETEAENSKSKEGQNADGCGGNGLQCRPCLAIMRFIQTRRFAAMILHRRHAAGYPWNMLLRNALRVPIFGVRAFAASQRRVCHWCWNSLDARRFHEEEAQARPS
jgi:hypothetical protein